MPDPATTDYLYEARRNGRPVEIPGGRLSFQEAHTLQLAVADRFVSDGDQIGGWKVGMTSGVARDRMGKGVRPFGYVSASRVVASGETLPYQNFLNCTVEAELGLVLGTDLAGPDVDADRARSACSRVVAALELNEYRTPGGAKGEPDLLIADGLGNWGIVVGDGLPADDFDMAGTSVELLSDGVVAETATAGKELDIDDPFLSLSRLCQALAAHGRGLRAGQVVITGSFTKRAVDAPGRWEARFAGVGTVSAELS